MYVLGTYMSMLVRYKGVVVCTRVLVDMYMYVQDSYMTVTCHSSIVLVVTHCLYPLVVYCLHDSPEQRPSVGEVRSYR